MSTFAGWTLATLALVAGYIGYGWRGVLLAATFIVFWLLLQFSRALRVMRLAAQAPVGHVASLVMLHAGLHAGMQMMDVVKLTRSLGRKLHDEPEASAWRDDSGAEVEVEFAGGRCMKWRLVRPD
jgi:Flp pilus assembly protein TadB